MSGPPRARVFISCGQSKEPDEAQVAGEIAARLEKLGFDESLADSQFHRGSRFLKGKSA
jgi:Fe-S oxidoreductase